MGIRKRTIKGSHTVCCVSLLFCLVCFVLINSKFLFVPSLHHSSIFRSTALGYWPSCYQELLRLMRTLKRTGKFGRSWQRKASTNHNNYFSSGQADHSNNIFIITFFFFFFCSKVGCIYSVTG